MFHQANVVACVRRPGKRGRRTSEVRTFGTTTRELLHLTDWLTTEHVPGVMCRDAQLQAFSGVLPGALQGPVQGFEHRQLAPEALRLQPARAADTGGISYKRRITKSYDAGSRKGWPRWPIGWPASAFRDGSRAALASETMVVAPRGYARKAVDPLILPFETLALAA